MENLEVIIVDYQKRVELAKKFFTEHNEDYIIPNNLKEGLLLLRNVDGVEQLKMYPKKGKDLWFYFRFNKTKNRYDIYLYDINKKEKDKTTLAFTYLNGIKIALAEKQINYKNYVKDRINLFESKPLKEHNSVYLPLLETIEMLNKAINEPAEDNKFTVIPTSFTNMKQQYEMADFWERVFMNQLSELLGMKLAAR